MRTVFVTGCESDDPACHGTRLSLPVGRHAGISDKIIDRILDRPVVRDPLDRVNTTDNTPAMIYYDIVPGDGFKLTVAPKGFGSENMSRILS